MPARLLRDNAFLVGAVSLPVAVVGLFLLVTAIPKLTVSPPGYDLLLQTTEYDRAHSSISVELFVRDEALQARLRVVKDAQTPRVRLWRFDHTTLSAREVPMNLPTLAGDVDVRKQSSSRRCAAAGLSPIRRLRTATSCARRTGAGQE